MLDNSIYLFFGRVVQILILELCLIAPTFVFAADEARDSELAISLVESRVREFFQAHAGSPLERAEKKPPLDPGRGNYVRAYSYSLVEFAARCLYLEEMIEQANAAIAENAQHYLDHPKDINDRDSFHWHADIVMRLLELYGTQGTKNPGLITPETEALALKPIWLYAKKSSKLSRATIARAQNWEFNSTENHHAMDFTVCWHLSKLAKDRPEYKNLPYDDGSTAAEHYQAWNEFFVVYCAERARKGPCIEIMCPGYNSVWLKGMYNFHDFGNQKVSRSAKLLLDLYFAYWAQEQMDGISGGGKTRIRGLKGLSNIRNGVPALGWLYFGIGQKPTLLMGNLNAALSPYCPPEVVADIALNSRLEGPYQVVQRAQGLGKQGIAHPDITATAVPNRFNTNGGGIIRTTYCDPAFTLGTLMTQARPLKDWVHISAQGRWQGVIFAGQPSSRIVPMVLPTKRDVLNGFWSVQHQGCLITQKLKFHKGGGDMVAWISFAGLSQPELYNGVVFVESEGAYAAIRIAYGGFDLQDDSLTVRSKDRSIRKAPSGIMVVPKIEDSPIILEVMAKSRVKSFEQFKNKVLACEINWDEKLLQYQSIYGDQFTFDASQQETPTVNDKPIDYAPKKVLSSPFLNADYNSGLVTIGRKQRAVTLNFNQANATEAK